MAAKVTSRTEVLQSLLTLLYSLLTLLHSAAEPQRQASQGFDDRGVLHFTILQGTAVQQDEGCAPLLRVCVSRHLGKSIHGRGSNDDATEACKRGKL